MPISRCAWLVPALVAAMGRMAGAQAPTLPSDTLKAHFAPRTPPGPHPELAPSLPGDTLEAVPAPPAPDGAILDDPEETPIPERIIGLRLA
jgi:hypothetical protein